MSSINKNPINLVQAQVQALTNQSKSSENYDDAWIKSVDPTLPQKIQKNLALENAQRQAIDDEFKSSENYDNAWIKSLQPTLLQPTLLQKAQKSIQDFSAKKPILFKALVATVVTAGIASILALCISTPPLGLTLVGLAVLVLAIKAGKQLYQQYKSSQEAKSNNESSYAPEDVKNSASDSKNEETSASADTGEAQSANKDSGFVGAFKKIAKSFTKETEPAKVFADLEQINVAK